MGQFTLRVTNTRGTCSAAMLSDNSPYSATVAVGPGASLSGAPNLAGGASAMVAGPNTASDLFAAVLVNGSSRVAGNISLYKCYTSGFIQGT